MSTTAYSAAIRPRGRCAASTPIPTTSSPGSSRWVTTVPPGRCPICHGLVVGLGLRRVPVARGAVSCRTPRSTGSAARPGCRTREGGARLVASEVEQRHASRASDRDRSGRVGRREPGDSGAFRARRERGGDRGPGDDNGHLPAGSTSWIQGRVRGRSNPVAVVGRGGLRRPRRDRRLVLPRAPASWGNPGPWCSVQISMRVVGARKWTAVCAARWARTGPSEGATVSAGSSLRAPATDGGYLPRLMVRPARRRGA